MKNPTSFERHASACQNLGHRPAAKPGFDLHQVAATDGDTIRNLKRLKDVPYGTMFEGQNGERFLVEDELI